MPRKFVLAGVKEEELRPDPKPEEPQTPKSKWSNFWYYHKWYVLAAAFALAVVVYFVVDIATKVNPDYYAMVVTESSYTYESTDALKKELLRYSEDVNHDEKRKMSTSVLSYGEQDGMTTETTTAHIMKMQILMSDGQTKLIVFDQSWYERIGAQVLESTELFTPLDIDDAGYNAEEHYWDWYGSDLQKSEWAKELPEHLYFGVRPAYDAEDEREARYTANAKKLLENLINGTPPETTAALIE